MSLVGVERKKVILDLLRLNGRVRTQELVERLEVSSESVRRYLEDLEADHKLKRVYGGAIQADTDREEPPHLKREITHVEAKRQIGRLAAELVSDGDVIVISEGTTAYQMVPFLTEKRRLTVLTNSVPVMSALIGYKNADQFDGDIWFTGGKVNSSHFRVSGTYAEQWMSAFHVNKAFIAIDGLSLERGVTSFDPDSGRLTRLFVERSSQTYVLADASKFHKARLYQIAELEDIDCIVTEAQPPQGWGETLMQKDVRWVSPQEA